MAGQRRGSTSRFQIGRAALSEAWGQNAVRVFAAAGEMNSSCVSGGILHEVSVARHPAWFAHVCRGWRAARPDTLVARNGALATGALGAGPWLVVFGLERRGSYSSGAAGAVKRMSHACDAAVTVGRSNERHDCTYGKVMGGSHRSTEVRAVGVMIWSRNLTYPPI